MDSAGDRPEKPRSALGGRFWLEERLGADATGELYRGLDLRSGTQTLVRIVRGEGSARRDRLLRETRRAAQVKHPGLAIVLGVGQTDEGDIYVAAETLTGDRLSDRLRIGERFDEWESAEIATQLAHALAAAHDADVVHRLLRPSLVVLTYEGEETRVKIEGLGLPRAPRAEGEPDEDPELAYSAPEQQRGETVGRRADVYSIGAMVYAMLTGEAPTPNARPVEGLLGDVVARCLAEDPKDRFVDTNALSAALQTKAQSLPPRMSSKMPMAISVPPAGLVIPAPASPPEPVAAQPAPAAEAISLAPETPAANSDAAVAAAAAQFDALRGSSIIPLSDDGVPPPSTTTAPPPPRAPAAPPERAPGRALEAVPWFGQPLPRAGAIAVIALVLVSLVWALAPALVVAIVSGGVAYWAFSRAPLPRP